MRHCALYRFASIALFVSACGFDDESFAEFAPQRETVGLSPRPQLPFPGWFPTEYEWLSDGFTTYDYDSFSTYGANLVDPHALSLRVYGVYAGDVIRVEALGMPYAEHTERDVYCDLRVHVADGLRAESQIAFGGSASFPLDHDYQEQVALSGVHTVTADGMTRIRVLGRVSRPDRFCGLNGAIEMRAEVQ